MTYGDAQDCTIGYLSYTRATCARRPELDFPRAPCDTPTTLLAMRFMKCVPNFSEGRDLGVIAAIRDASASVTRTHILDVSSDASHHRTVITFVAPLDVAVNLAFAGVREATARIDLATHIGEHPRLRGTDVVPFIALDGETMDDYIALARVLGERVARELSIPVYLYERAAQTSAREKLADVRP